MSDTTPAAHPAAAPETVTLPKRELLDLQTELALLQRKNALLALEIEILQKERALADRQQEQDGTRIRQENERLQKKVLESTRDLEALRESVAQINHQLAPSLFVDLNNGELFQQCRIVALDLKWPKFTARLLLPAKDRYL